MFQNTYMKRLPGFLFFYLVLLVLSLPVLGTKLYASDLWKALYSGRYLAWFGKFPDHSTFTFSPVVEQLSRNSFNWIGNLFFYYWYKFLGILGVQALRPVTAIGAVLLVHSQIRFRKNLPVLLGLVAFVYALQQKLTIRTSLFAVIFFSLVIWLWIRYDETGNKIWLYAQLPIMVLWSNIHGSYLIGTVLLVLLILGKVYQHIRFGESAYRKLFMIRIFTVLAILLAGVTLVKPDPDTTLLNRIAGLDENLASTTATINANTQTGDRNESQSYLQPVRKALAPSTTMRSQEFDSPFERLELLFVLLGLACILLGIVPLALGSYSFVGPYSIGFFGILILGISFIRTTAYLPLFVFPFLFRYLSKRSFSSRQRWWVSVGSLVILAGLAGVVVGMSLTQSTEKITGFRQQELGLGQVEKFSGSVPGVLLRNYPNERFYNTYSLGGYLIWEWWPHKKVFIDSKSSAYTDEFKRAWKSTPFSEFLQNHGLRHAVITNRSKVNHRYFHPSSKWSTITKDRGIVAYARRNS